MVRLVWGDLERIRKRGGDGTVEGARVKREGAYGGADGRGGRWRGEVARREHGGTSSGGRGVQKSSVRRIVPPSGAPSPARGVQEALIHLREVRRGLVLGNPYP